MSLFHQLTDAEREAAVVVAVVGVDRCEVPHHLRAGLVLYVSDGILPGGYLQAVLCNDLAQAVLRSSPGALGFLPALVYCLRFYVPIRAWGSREKVLAWTTTPDRLEID